ncbi:TIGR00366 family protein [Thalassotalea sp. Y01]|uniref:YfcC family protein n=1 Tax=Thalassotalea sp. Y01 TaxID=2729613 RepID=UPI00145DB719|nr:TIGR00366 family protein [Thalassotalea sp. Y01]NMP17374.1 YfcC family protein [Thalassotalea sp. Y01]
MKATGIKIDSLVLIFSFIIFAQLLTFVIPQGSFEREPFTKNPSHEIVVAGTYDMLPADEHVSLPLWHFLDAITKGMAEAHDIIFLIFIVGGVIEVVRKTGAIDAALMSAVHKMGHNPSILILGCFAMFGLGSFTIGMGEEYVPLIPILVSMALVMRMDAMVAMAMVWIPYGIGWGCAGINPFNVLIAQNIAGIPLTSGWEIRALMMLAFLALGFHHTYRYAMRVKNDPSKSLLTDVNYDDGFTPPDDTKMNLTRTMILIVFMAGIGLFIWGSAKYGWYITELNTIFLGIGLAAAMIGRLGATNTSEAFLKGASLMIGAALIVGFARTISVVLADGQILDSIVNSVAQLLQGVPAEISGIGMLLVQSLCNFFIPSGSGQAFVTMPIMSPLATLTGVPQQTAVLAFQFGDGFTNMFVPTSALLMGGLALGRVPYIAWLRFIMPLMIKILLLASVFIVLSIHFPF